jgi:hypothetical protein
VNHSQAIEQILSKLSLSRALREVAMRCGDDADIHVGIEAASADGLDFTALEEPQEQRLHSHTHVPHFIQEERASIRQSQFTGVIAIGTGETAAHMPEHLRFEKILGQAGAVHRDERAFGASGQVMNVAGHEIFSDPALTGEQYLGTISGGSTNAEKDGLHGLALAHDGTTSDGVNEWHRQPNGRRTLCL